jgi:hypothetical protein
MVVIFNQVYNMGGNADSLKLLYLGPKKRSNVIMDISSMDIFFILKSMERVEIHIIVRFVLRNRLSISLKLIIMAG